MNLNFVYFNTRLSEKILEPSDRRMVATAVCAQVIADAAPINDSVGPDQIENYYAMNLKSTVMEKISQLNESINIDTELALEWVRAYWMVRSIVSNPGDPARRKHSANRGYFDTILGVGIYVKEEHSCFVNKYNTEIIDLVCDLYNIVNSTINAPTELIAQEV